MKLTTVARFLLLGLVVGLTTAQESSPSIFFGPITGPFNRFCDRVRNRQKTAQESSPSIFFSPITRLFSRICDRILDPQSCTENIGTGSCNSAADGSGATYDWCLYSSGCKSRAEESSVAAGYEQGDGFCRILFLNSNTEGREGSQVCPGGFAAHEFGNTADSEILGSSGSGSVTCYKCREA